MKKKWWYGFLWLFLLFSPSVHSMAQPAETEESMPVLVLGEDLTEKEKETVLGLLGVDSKDLSKYKILTITNEEEREYLGSYVKPEIVGSRAVSCILLSPSEEKTGLSVSLQNITWCTEPMYRKLLVEQCGKKCIWTGNSIDTQLLLAGRYLAGKCGCVLPGWASYPGDG